MKKIQFVLWGVGDWGLDFFRPSGTLGLIYRWTLRVGPLEVRRIVTDDERRSILARAEDGRTR